ncbi:MAG: aminodeoxychorismate synthase component I [Ancrocorticia sp.]
MILLVDNADSYTYNLYQLISGLTDDDVAVIPASEIASPSAEANLVPQLVREGRFSHVVISPGPGHPGQPLDFAGSQAVIEAADGIPLLGVCLGHQGLGLTHGGEVVRAPRARHGYISRLAHSGEGLFAGIPQDFQVVRYHSLHVVNEDALRVHARSEDGLVMAVEVAGQPHWGVQFHPESILSEYGRELAGNFLKLSADSSRVPSSSDSQALPNSARASSLSFSDSWVRSDSAAHPDSPVSLAPPVVAVSAEQLPVVATSSPPSSLSTQALTSGSLHQPSSHPSIESNNPHRDKLELHAQVRSLAVVLDTEATFHALAARNPGAPLFWLDPDQASGHGSRYSMMGAASGPNSQTIRYRVEERAALIRTGEEVEELRDIDVFELLNDLIEATEVTGLPEDFPVSGGYVGYFGYELKALVLGPNAHRADTPDAYWLRPESLVVYDHRERTTHLLWLGPKKAIESGAAAATLDRLEEVLRGEVSPATESGLALGLATKGAPPAQTEPVAVPPEPGSNIFSGPEPSTSEPETNSVSEAPANISSEPEPSTSALGSELAGGWRLSRSNYLDRIERARQQLHSGDSYEVCLTDRFLGTGTFDALAYYSVLRAANPAPYAAYFRFTEFDDDVEIASASPERFLTVDGHRVVESKPIKGTAPRGDTPQEDVVLSRALREDPKTRAENLMIVDLLRNDLGRVCRAGSVSVPGLMEVESYPAVHQLVSTIRGELRPDVSTLDAIRACFPGGSMTGAPKARTVEIIDALEAGARGIYSGAIGYLGFDGRSDLNIAIRTLVRNGSHWSVGAGGAIVLDSDPDAEHEEKNLKADKLLRVLRDMSAARGQPEVPGRHGSGRSVSNETSGMVDDVSDAVDEPPTLPDQEPHSKPTKQGEHS